MINLRARLGLSKGHKIYLKINTKMLALEKSLSKLNRKPNLKKINLLLGQRQQLLNQLKLQLRDVCFKTMRSNKSVTTMLYRAMKFTTLGHNSFLCAKCPSNLKKSVTLKSLRRRTYSQALPITRSLVKKHYTHLKRLTKLLVIKTRQITSPKLKVFLYSTLFSTLISFLALYLRLT